MTTLTLGKKGEELVVDYIRQLGFTLIAQNYRQRCGEIDIIAQKDNTVAFIEVKLRQTTYFYLSEVITPAKQRKIIKTAHHFILFTGKQSDSLIYRFDVALLELQKGEYSITYIRDAFRKDCY